jgi:hypothetical protein
MERKRPSIGKIDLVYRQHRPSNCLTRVSGALVPLTPTPPSTRTPHSPPLPCPPVALPVLGATQIPGTQILKSYRPSVSNPRPPAMEHSRQSSLSLSLALTNHRHDTSHTIRGGGYMHPDKALWQTYTRVCIIRMLLKQT